MTPLPQTIEIIAGVLGGLRELEGTNLLLKTPHVSDTGLAD